MASLDTPTQTDKDLTSVAEARALARAARQAQGLLAELTRFTDRTALVHGMMLPMIDAYRAGGVNMLPASALIERPRGSSVEEDV